MAVNEYPRHSRTTARAGVVGIRVLGKKIRHRRIVHKIGRNFGIRYQSELFWVYFRTTALTNMGNKGATMAEIVSFSGNKLNSPVLETYVKPGREAAQRARTKLDHGSEQT